MTLTLGDLLILAGINLMVWIAVSYVKPYLGQKGKNLATHEDIEKLVDQVTATTQATEDIRTALTGTLWESQER